MALARISGGEVTRMDDIDGRLPALESRGGAALVAVHDHQSVRTAWIGRR